MSNADHVEQFRHIVDLHVVLWSWGTEIQPPDHAIVVARNSMRRFGALSFRAEFPLPFHGASIPVPARAIHAYDTPREAKRLKPARYMHALDELNKPPCPTYWNPSRLVHATPALVLLHARCPSCSTSGYKCLFEQCLAYLIGECAHFEEVATFLNIVHKVIQSMDLWERHATKFISPQHLDDF
jgi:hypothetical protein